LKGVVAVSTTRRSSRPWETPFILHLRLLRVEGLDAEAIGREILATDSAFMWVVVLNEKGETLAHVHSEKRTNPKVKLGKQAKDRLGALDAVLLAGATQAEKWYGKEDFILLAYRRAKVMLMPSKKHGVYLAARIPSSAMAEHLYAEVKSVLGKR
jgi:hypothetical protein